MEDDKDNFIGREKHNYMSWKRVTITSGTLAVATVLIQAFASVFFHINYSHYPSVIVLMAAIFILPFIYAQNERGKLPIILWLEGLALLFNMFLIFPKESWLRFAVQAVIAIILFITYRKYKNKLF
ncbi:hypothetical protein [Breznakia pachnodae]|uniref:Membrane protein n=1 Tax=Breznakia pachnodae TaxID=265178 RepID=A0ABU0E4A3_9FIRM|nr:hypothetical protein [Breznakia pachnodae]MDQ0361727.1 putative membrane protein [Breznakia pachnodae]